MKGHLSLGISAGGQPADQSRFFRVAHLESIYRLTGRIDQAMKTGQAETVNTGPGLRVFFHIREKGIIGWESRIGVDQVFEPPGLSPGFQILPVCIGDAGSCSEIGFDQTEHAPGDGQRQEQNQDPSRQKSSVF